MSATAVILQHRDDITGDTVLTVALNGNVVNESFGSTTDITAARAELIDAFLDLWNLHRGFEDLVLYVSDVTVRELLKEQAVNGNFEGLLVRDTVTGQKLQATWEACSVPHRRQILQLNPRFDATLIEPVPLVVVATDASKALYSNSVGLSAVSGCGRIKTKADKLSTVLDAELAAINLALKYFGQRALRIEVLTDSQQAIQYIEGNRHWYSLTASNLDDTIYGLYAKGVKLNFTWVRGHNGHGLNEIADRAAKIARHCKRIKVNPEPQLINNLRSELGEIIEGRTPESWLAPNPSNNNKLSCPN